PGLLPGRRRARAAQGARAARGGAPARPQRRAEGRAVVRRRGPHRRRRGWHPHPRHARRRRSRLVVFGRAGARHAVVAGGVRPPAARSRGLRDALDRVRPAGLRRDARRQRRARRARRRGGPGGRTAQDGARPGGAGGAREGRPPRGRAVDLGADGARDARGARGGRGTVRFSVVVVAHRSRRELETLLPALSDDAEVIVVDTDGSAAELERARILDRHDNPGFGAANNAGVALASHDVCVLLNPDIVAGPGAVERLAVLAAGREALVVPRLRNADGSIQRSAFALRGTPP